jgi:hypothetical protein
MYTLSHKNGNVQSVSSQEAAEALVKEGYSLQMEKKINATPPPEGDKLSVAGAKTAPANVSNESK